MTRIEYEDRSVKVVRRVDGSVTWDPITYTPENLESRIRREVIRLEERLSDLRVLAAAVGALTDADELDRLEVRMRCASVGPGGDICGRKRGHKGNCSAMALASNPPEWALGNDRAVELLESGILPSYLREPRKEDAQRQKENA